MASQTGYARRCRPRTVVDDGAMMRTWRGRGGIVVLALALQGCASPPAATAPADASAGPPQWTAYRFREDFRAGLNADAGWAAPANRAPVLRYDEPFRLRIQVRGGVPNAAGHLLSLQYRQDDGVWLPVGVSDFPYPSFATPVVSVVSTGAYQHGAETERLLGDAAMDWDEGAGLNAVATTPVWRGGDVAMEWEWPLVIRRFSDGPTFAEDGGVFAFRVVDGAGRPLPGQAPAELQVNAAPGHLGGTFVETPARLGPYQDERGYLWFFMEPAETDNRLMAVYSTDRGRSWREADPAGRPRADDLEGVASARTGSTIHLIHQVSREVFYHAFRLGESASDPGAWLIDSQSIATPQEPPTQFADLVARGDGSLVTLYGGVRRLFLQVRSPEGEWGAPREIDSDTAPELSGPVLAVNDDNLVTLAYTGRDGRGFIRHLRSDGSLSPRQVLSTRLGVEDRENGAILPLAIVPNSGATVAVYRETDGRLYERRFAPDGELSVPVRVSALPVVTNAVDSEQAGADLVAHGSTLHLLFIEANSRSIYHVRSDQPGTWSAPRPVVEGIDASWVRGSIHDDASGNPVYGFVYDAGSRGGSGFNRYLAIPP